MVDNLDIELGRPPQQQAMTGVMMSATPRSNNQAGGGGPAGPGRGAAQGGGQAPAAAVDRDRLKKSLWEALRRGMGVECLHKDLRDPEVASACTDQALSELKALLFPRQGATDEEAASATACRQIVVNCELLRNCGPEGARNAATDRVLQEADSLPRTDLAALRECFSLQAEGAPQVERFGREVDELAAAFYDPKHPRHFSNQRACALSMAACCDPQIFAFLLELTKMDESYEWCKTSVWLFPEPATWSHNVLVQRQSYMTPLAAAVLSNRLENVQMILERADKWLSPKLGLAAMNGGRDENRVRMKIWVDSLLCAHMGYVFTPLSVIGFVTPHVDGDLPAMAQLLRAHDSLLIHHLESRVAVPTTAPPKTVMASGISIIAQAYGEAAPPAPPAAAPGAGPAAAGTVISRPQGNPTDSFNALLLMSLSRIGWWLDKCVRPFFPPNPADALGAQPGGVRQSPRGARSPARPQVPEDDEQGADGNDSELEYEDSDLEYGGARPGKQAAAASADETPPFRLSMGSTPEEREANRAAFQEGWRRLAALLQVMEAFAQDGRPLPFLRVFQAGGEAHAPPVPEAVMRFYSDTIVEVLYGFVTRMLVGNIRRLSHGRYVLHIRGYREKHHHMAVALAIIKRLYQGWAAKVLAAQEVGWDDERCKKVPDSFDGAPSVAAAANAPMDESVQLCAKISQLQGRLCDALLQAVKPDAILDLQIGVQNDSYKGKLMRRLTLLGEMSTRKYEQSDHGAYTKRLFRKLPPAVLKAIIAAEDEPPAMERWLHRDMLFFRQMAASPASSKATAAAEYFACPFMPTLAEGIARASAGEGTKWDSSEYQHMARCAAGAGCALGTSLALRLALVSDSTQVVERVLGWVAAKINQTRSYCSLSDGDLLAALAKKYPRQTGELLCTVPFIRELHDARSHVHVERDFDAWFLHDGAEKVQRTELLLPPSQGAAGQQAAADPSPAAAGEDPLKRSTLGTRQLSCSVQGSVVSALDASYSAKNLYGLIQRDTGFQTHLTRRWLFLEAYMKQGPTAIIFGILYLTAWTSASIVYTWIFHSLKRLWLEAGDWIWNNVCCCSPRWQCRDHLREWKPQENQASVAEEPKGSMLTAYSVPLPVNVVTNLELLEALVDAGNDVPAAVFGSPALQAMVSIRWQVFTKHMLLYHVVDHLVFMGFFLSYALLLDGVKKPSSPSSSPGEEESFYEDCIPLTPTRRGLLAVIFIMTLNYLFQEAQQIIRAGTLRGLFKPWNMLDVASILLTLAIFINGCRSCDGSARFQRSACAIEVLILFLRFLYYTMAASTMGSFFRMVIEVVRDLFYFFVFLTVVWCGFTVSVFVLEPDHGVKKFTSGTLKKFFTMIFGDFQATDLVTQHSFNPSDGTSGSSVFQYSPLSQVFGAIFMVFVVIILLNLLIAIINDTYERIKSNEDYEGVRNKAIIISETEALLWKDFRRKRDALFELDEADQWVHFLRREDGQDVDGDVNEEEERRNADGLVMEGRFRRYDGHEKASGDSWKGRARDQKEFTTRRVEEVEASLRKELAANKRKVMGLEAALREQHGTLAAIAEHLNVEVKKSK